jgi:hypothetical protein
VRVEAAGDVAARRVDRQVVEHDRGRIGVTRRVLDRRLEPVAHHEHDARRRDLVDLLRRHLEVVGLGARRREIDDLDASAADLPGGLRERVERGDDA